MKKLLFLLGLVVALLGESWAQISDDFKDLNAWQGEVEKFESVAGQLHLNDASAISPAYLVTPSEIGLEATWEFWVKMSFAPSSSNKLEIALMSDNRDLNGGFNGYYLSVGENGSLDAIELFKKEGTVSTKLGRGIDGRFATELDSFLVKVSRNSQDLWVIYTDIGTGFEQEFQVTDGSYQQSKFFGFKPIYTSTRSALFYFDNLRIDGISFVDTVKPTVLSSNLLNDSTVNLWFSEPIESSSITISNIKLNGKIPRFYELNDRTLSLVFDVFEADISLDLSVKNIQDLGSNPMDEYRSSFFFHRNKVGDIVISEVLFNPPSGGVDYIEVYLNSDFHLASDDFFMVSLDPLTGLEIQRKPLPIGLSLESKKYYVLTENKQWVLDNYPSANVTNIIEMDIPSMNDDEGKLTLFSGSETKIDEVYYSEKFHVVYLTDEEGVSLERIDLQAVALDGNNWFSAPQSAGFGTPTQENSANRDVGYSNFSLTNERISPDGDGYEDFTQLTFENVDSGTLLTVSLYDRNGYLMHQPYRNYDISGTGSLRIDGTKNGTNILSPGIYILFLEWFDVNGNTYQKKLPLTINLRF